jgi:membrane fusion protein (multidrug efflux system)
VKFNSNILLLLAVLLLTAACSKAPNADAPARPSSDRSVPVIAEVLRFERDRVRLEAVGTSRARLSAELYATVSGEVVSVNFKPGQAVKLGDVLLQLDAEKEELAVRLAELNLEDAERLYDRYVRSADGGAVLPTALDASRTAAETAGVELEKARIALADRTIEAFYDGYVGVTDIGPGDRLDTNTLITTLDDRSSLFVSFDVPEAIFGELSVGDAVELKTRSDRDSEIVGEIIDIGSRIDPQNRTFVVRAVVDNDLDQLRPGMSFKVRIDVQGDLHAVVTETGLQWGADGAYVWTIVDGLATRVPVQLVQRREGRVLVDGDLTDGSIIVVEGTQSMRNGIAVSHEIQRVATGGDTTPVLD